MKTWRKWPVYVVLAVMLLVATALLLPSIGLADPGGETQPPPPPVDGQTGICVTGTVIDKAHVGIGGIQVSATSADPGSGLSTKSEADGSFRFTGLRPGNWTFRVTVPDSWEAVTPAEFPLELAYGHDGCYEIRFKLNPVGCTVVHKTDDKGNPLQGWNITLTGPAEAKGVTDANGIARFDKLPPGKYLVKEDVTYPWQAVAADNQTIQVKPAWTREDCGAVTFKNVLPPTACITGFKVDDQHQPLKGWRIHAERTDGNSPVFHAVTGDNGQFDFKNLTLGTWKLWEDVQPWWTAVTPSTFEVTLAQASQTCVVVRFKNRPPDLCAEGYKVDENGKPLEGWTIRAYPAADPTQYITATTDYRGYYRFVGLTLADWIFEEQHKVGWTALSDTKFKVPMEGGEYCVQVPTFKNKAPQGCIDGIKVDNLRYGLPGWLITVQPQSGGPTAQTYTDGTGRFRFEGLPVGKYWVWEENQPGWAPVTPPKVEASIEANDENRCVHVGFINKQVPRDICIDGFKLDRNGEIGLAGFKVKATLQGSNTAVTATTDGIGYFRFGNLVPGTYDVSVDEQTGWVPDGPTVARVKVDWPPKLACTRVKFYDVQQREGQPSCGGKGLPPCKPPQDGNPTDQQDGAAPAPDSAAPQVQRGQGRGPAASKAPAPPPAPPKSGPNGSAGKPPLITEPPPDGCRAAHIVTPRDTLADLAAMYNTSIRKLMAANRIANPNVIHDGTKLCIP